MNIINSSMLSLIFVSLLNRFALVVLPVYEDEDDQRTSPFNLPNSSPFSWSWLSTINRVNSQVQKVCDPFPELQPCNLLVLADSYPRIRHNTLKVSALNEHPSISSLLDTLYGQRSRHSSIYSSTYARLVY